MNQIQKLSLVLRVGCLSALLFSAVATARANVGDPASWKPAFSKSFKAPPADEPARAATFAQRNSAANLKRLAQEFFSLIDLDKVPGTIRAALERGDYEGALDAYRDFFMDRLGRFSPDERQNSGIRPRQPPIPFEKAYLQTADDLMQNKVVFGMIDMPLSPSTRTAQDYCNICNHPDNQRKKGNVWIEFGVPGHANWTWQPDGFVPLGFPHLPFDKTFMSTACGRPHFFAPLLVKYIETKDTKYWEKWIGFMDDTCLNWHRDTVQAGLNPSHNQNNIEFFSDGLWANLSFLMRNSPEQVRRLPSPTLARLLERMWMGYMSDALQYGRNASTARRIMFDNWHGMRLAVSFPAFNASQYCIRESLRAMELLPMLSIMPDGCDVHDSRNYNKGTPEYVRMVYAMLRNSRQALPWVDEAWFQSLHETMKLHANFIIRELWVTGGYPHWNLLHAERGVFVGDHPYLDRFVPEAFADPDNRKILSAIFEDGKAGTPSFTSDAFPYGGYYCVRTGWGKEDQWLYMPSTRPVSSVTHPDNNNFSLYAYGQHTPCAFYFGEPKMKRTTLTAMVVCLSLIGTLRADEAEIAVDAGKVISHVTPYMSGIVLEDCNHEIYGGLYSQMIFGESFQEPPTSLVKGFTACCGTWSVKHEELIGASRVPAKLIADGPILADGEVGVEICCPSPKQTVVAGLLVRAKEAGPGYQNVDGYEVLVHGFCATVRLSRYAHLKQFHRDARPMPSLEDWVALVVKLKGNTIETYANGRLMEKYEDPGSRVVPGRVGLVLHCTGARFRNLWISSDGQTTKLPFQPETAGPQDEVSSQWQAVRRGDVTGRITLETREPLFGQQSQRLTVTGGQGQLGIENRGLNRWEMSFQAGKPYEGCLRVKTKEPADVYVTLESGDGSKVHSETSLRVSSGGWQRVDFTLTPTDSDPKGRFTIALRQPGSVVVGYAFLQPGAWGRYKGLPVRGDIAEALTNGTFKVARYGGAMVHGGYRWKPMIGPRDRRPPYGSGYYSYPTHGWGILDFLNLTEAAGMLGIPDFDMGETPQDMADFVEYVNGPAQSTWGRRRLADGHPQPYNLKHIELGNESGVDRQYWLWFQPLAEAIWRKDPKIIFVVGDYEYPEVIKDPYHMKAAHITTLEAHRDILALAKKYDAEVWFDVHVGTGDPFMRDGLRGLPSFVNALEKIGGGAKYKVCVFELNAYNHDHARGLSNARCIGLLDRLGDKVPVVTSATGLQPYGHNDNDWDEGLIFFTPTQVFVQPAYYAAQMISKSYQPLYVKADVRCATDALQANAYRSNDEKTLVLRVVNAGERPLRTRITLGRFAPTSSAAQVTELCGNYNDVNTPEAPERVKPSQKLWPHGAKNGIFTYNFPPRSFTVLRLDGGKDQR